MTKWMWGLGVVVPAMMLATIVTTAEAGVPPACGSGAGDCATENGTPGCDDVDCCGAVCATDQFCCEVEWDDICVDWAQGFRFGAPVGACCYPDGSCITADSNSCGNSGGDYQGDYTYCAGDPAAAERGNPVQCPQPEVCGPGAGSCTEPNGTPGCDDVNCCETVCAADPFCCDTAWDSICVVGANDMCSGTPTGACCLLNVSGSCLDVTEDECFATGGDYQGDGSFCALPGAARGGGVICDEPLIGACCYLDITFGEYFCQNGSELDCIEDGGEYQGDGTFCSDDPLAVGIPIDCNPSDGACCFPDGSCVTTDIGSCGNSGGEYQGDGTFCAADEFLNGGKGYPIECPQPGDGGGRTSATEKGSLLIFSKVEIRWDATGNVIQDTFLDISNDWPEDVMVQMYFVNGDAPLNEPGVRLHPGWNWVDVGIMLTKNQPAYWSALTGQPGPGGAAVSRFTILDPSEDPLAQGRPAPDGSSDRVLRGFVYAWAIDNEGCEISWNHLKGDATLVNYKTSSAWEYNAWSFQDANDLEPGSSLNEPCGRLDLDGDEYVYSFDQLQLDFYAAGSQAFSGGAGPFASTITMDTDLTLHPVDADLRQETDGPVRTKANFVIWNEDETQLTGLHRCIDCWDQTLLSQYVVFPNHFLLANLQTDKGRARIDGLAGVNDCGSGTQTASLLGVAAKHLTVGNGASHAAGGVNLIGMGVESATVRYDPVTGGGGPPTLQDPQDGAYGGGLSPEVKSPKLVPFKK